MLGATAAELQFVLTYDVSILSQLRCWEQRSTIALYCSDSMFQSSPSLGAGSNLSFLGEALDLVKFQSSPSLGAGSNTRSVTWDKKSFSPLPARCWEQHLDVVLLSKNSFNPLQTGAGSNSWRMSAEFVYVVSILSQLRCWEQHFRDMRLGQGSCFNPLPA